MLYAVDEAARMLTGMPVGLGGADSPAASSADSTTLARVSALTGNQSGVLSGRDLSENVRSSRSAPWAGREINEQAQAGSGDLASQTRLATCHLLRVRHSLHHRSPLVSARQNDIRFCHCPAVATT